MSKTPNKIKTLRKTLRTLALTPYGWLLAAVHEVAFLHTLHREVRKRRIAQIYPPQLGLRLSWLNASLNAQAFLADYDFAKGRVETLQLRIAATDRLLDQASETLTGRSRHG